MNQERIDLPQEEIPRKWYNILPDLPEPLPVYKEVETGRETKHLPSAYTKTASNLEFPENSWIEIPNAVVSAYIHCGRPRPLIRAHRLEKFLKTPAKIYYKCEDLPPGGTFKTNTSLPQAYWAMKEGYTRTVFGGTTTTRTKFIHAFTSNMFGLTPTLFLPRAQCEQNRTQVFFLKKMLGVDLLESPSNQTETGRTYLKENPTHPGSMAIVGAEIIEELAQNEDAVTLSSSFLNHTLLTQTITGLEVEQQLKRIDEEPTIFIASVGCGSHFFGLIAPFVREHLRKKLSGVKFLGVESETSASLTHGKYVDVPLGSSVIRTMTGVSVKTYQVGGKRPLPTIRGEGIQVGIAAPLLSFLHHLGVIDTRVYPKDEQAVFEAARIFLQTEGYLLAPESAYTIRAAIDEAVEAKKKGEEKVIVTNVSAMTYLDFGEKRNYASFDD